MQFTCGRTWIVARRTTLHRHLGQGFVSFLFSLTWRDNLDSKQCISVGQEKHLRPYLSKCVLIFHIQEVLMFWSSRLASPCLQSSSPLSWLNFFKWLSVRPMGNCQCFEGFGFPSKKELNVGTTGGCGLAVAWYGRNLGIRALFQSLYGLKLCKGKS